MRLVVISDLHGDWLTDGYERFDDLVEALKPVVEQLLLKPSTFVFLGDLSNPYSRNVHRVLELAVRLATNLLKKEIPQYWFVGNHDIVEDQHGSHTLMALTGLAEVVDKPGVRVIEGNNCHSKYCVALPFTSTRHNYDPAQVVRDARKELEGIPDKDIIVAGHLNIDGITAGSETNDMPRGRDVFWPEEAVKECFPDALWLNGHYHEQQVFRGIHIPGSLLRLTHGEEENTPGFLVINR